MGVGPVPKGTSPYKDPLKVDKVLGQYTFMLSNGQRWSACHMKRWLEPLPATYLEQAAMEPEELHVLRKSMHANKP